MIKKTTSAYRTGFVSTQFNSNKALVAKAIMKVAIIIIKIFIIFYGYNSSSFFWRNSNRNNGTVQIIHNILHLPYQMPLYWIWRFLVLWNILNKTPSGSRAAAFSRFLFQFMQSPPRSRNKNNWFWWWNRSFTKSVFWVWWRIGLRWRPQ